MEKLFQGLFDSTQTSVIDVVDFILCLSVSLIIGLAIAFTFTFKNRHTKSYVVTLALLPAVVCVVIMMVNGNIGAGIAVAGAFSLVRFRSAPGTASEITMIFLAMSAGLLSGMGYLGFAILFTAITCGVFILYNSMSLGTKSSESKYKTLKITIPEDLDYSGVFDDVFKEYTVACELIKVRTHNMGSMFRLTYDVVLRDPAKEKEFIDKLRVRNGNLEIMISKQETSQGVL